MNAKKPRPPAHLTVEAKKLWQRIFDENEVDEAALLLLNTLCEQWDRMTEARAAIAKDGAVCRDRFGQSKASPWISIERDAAATMTRCWRLLGFDQVPSGAMGRPPGR